MKNNEYKFRLIESMSTFVGEKATSVDEIVSATEKFQRMFDSAMEPERKFNDNFIKLVNDNRMRGLRRSTDGYGKIKFLALPDLLHIVLPVLEEYGFALTFDSSYNGVDKTHCVTATLVGHGWERTSHYYCQDGRVLQSKVHNPAQDAGAILSYGRRNAAYAVLSIQPSNEDIDAKYNEPVVESKTNDKPGDYSGASVRSAVSAKQTQIDKARAQAKEYGLQVLVLAPETAKDKEELKDKYRAKQCADTKQFFITCKELSKANDALAKFNPMLTAEQSEDIFSQ